jgi:predicted ribosome quality control (RQC) complex YloA/Tae2 family protein
MPLDAICLSAVRKELSERITGKKIEKIQQPERDLLILPLRGIHSPPCRLLISIGSGDARVHLTEFGFENPKSPPMFCMLLRKHLTGATIESITQPHSERLLELSLKTTNAIGSLSYKRLIIELTGRLSNVILTDDEGLIIDCQRRIGGGADEKRLVLPGLVYRNPPPQIGKLDPIDVTEKQVTDALSDVSHNSIDKWLVSKFVAISPLVAREVSWRAYGEVDFRLDKIKDEGAAIYRELKKLVTGDLKPWLILSSDGIPFDFSYTRLQQYENSYRAELQASFQTMLDEYYTRTAQADRVRQRSAATMKLMKTARSRLIRKITAQKSELEGTAKRDYHRECGDIVTANMHLLKKGQQALIADDFFSEDGKQRRIELDPLKSPQQNAAKFYKAYTKAKNAVNYLTEQVSLAETELIYVESVIEMIKRVENESDLDEIRNELSQTGYIKTQKQQTQQKFKKSRKQAESSPMRFTSSAGMQILAGRNNTQNDRLTLKLASRHDTWFHAQKIHGTHVIVKSSENPIDDATLNEAAAIAAYYSAARSDSKVPVDYTQVKNVKKPPGGRPGMVIYASFQTVLTTPDVELIGRLRI